MGGHLDIDAPTWRRVSPLLDAALDLPPQDRAGRLETLPALHANLKGTLRKLLARSARIETHALLSALPKLDESNATATTAAAAALQGRHAARDVVGCVSARAGARCGRHGCGVARRSRRRADAAKWRLEAAVRAVQRRPGGTHRARARDPGQPRPPHIARLYDAGVAADGQPDLALEHVDGQRSDRYGEEEGLGVAARLRLFVQAARAVAHAQAQPVVRRDIKPSNLLVDAGGHVKLLDFGIARLLDDGRIDQPELTQQGHRVLRG